MKNSADQGGCYPPCPSATVDNILRDLKGIQTLDYILLFI